MGVKDREKQPDVALVVVIDKSGSMDACHCNSFNDGRGGGGSGIRRRARKVDIGKEAIMRAAAALTSRDELGVVAFDERALGREDVAARRPGRPAERDRRHHAERPDEHLRRASTRRSQSLKDAKATRRHIILLTDGWSSSGQYGDILKRMKAAGITLSTVGAGGGSNPFLEDLAKQGGGRFYDAANPQSIPDIFLKETQQVAGQQIVEEPFFPILTSNSPILRGIEGGLPGAAGLQRDDGQARRADGVRDGARRPAPRAVAVRPGTLGGVDVRHDRQVGEETGSPWPSFTKFFSQMVGWTFPGEETGGIEDDVRDARRPDVPAGRERQRGRLAARLLRDARDRRGPGLRAGRRDAGPDRAGRVRDAAGRAALGCVRRAGDPDEARHVAARPHHRAGGADGRRVPPARGERAAAGGDPQRDHGKAVESPALVWTHDLATTSSYTELWPWLLVLAFLLWPLDIALRRVSMGRRELADARRWMSETARGRRVAARPDVVADLMVARERAGSSAARSAILRGGTATADAPQAGTTAAAPGAVASAPAPAPAARPVPASPPAPTPAPAAAPPAAVSPATNPGPPSVSPPAAPAPAPATPTPPPTAPGAPATTPTDGDTIARLREAKKRARG